MFFGRSHKKSALTLTKIDRDSTVKTLFIVLYMGRSVLLTVGKFIKPFKSYSENRAACGVFKANFDC